MNEMDVLFPIPQGGRNADDMGNPPAAQPAPMAEPQVLSRFALPDPTPAPDDLVAALRLRILSEHGGPSGMMHGWNLTHGDSIMHREAAAAIVALRERVAGLLNECSQSVHRAERAESDNAKLRACVAAADAMREAFAKNPGHWPQMGWTPVDFDAARAALGDKP